MGLVNAVLPTEQVRDWIQEKAAAIAGMSRAAMLLLKKSLLLGYGNWASSLAEVERIYMQELMATDDTREGLAAFMEKRKPAWSHQ
jgi:enoyl-CoA hydratase/carnithine racemase